jgi:hypothetical protein
VINFKNHEIPTNVMEDMVSSALSSNKPVVIRGIGEYPVCKELTVDFLDKHYAISLHRVVWIHGIA